LARLLRVQTLTAIKRLRYKLREVLLGLPTFPLRDQTQAAQLHFAAYEVVLAATLLLTIIKRSDLLFLKALMALSQFERLTLQPK
jgi:hypothetical protein